MTEQASRFDEMPLNRLTHDFGDFAKRMAGQDSDHIEFRGTGLAMRAYMYMFTIGPFRERLEDLPDRATEGLEKVAEACLKVLKTSKEYDSLRPIYPDIPVQYDEDGNEHYDFYQIIYATQSGLESSNEPPKGEFLEHLKDNEFSILSGQVDIDSTPTRRMYGPSVPTKEAVRELALIAGEQFGIVAGGMEFLIPEEDLHTWNRYKNQLAGHIRSEWRNPYYVEPANLDRII